jgi:hypothetical protein
MGVNSTVTSSVVFHHDTEHADHPTIHNLVKAGYACMKTTNLTGVLSSPNHLVFLFDTFPKTDQGKKGWWLNEVDVWPICTSF